MTQPESKPPRSNELEQHIKELAANDNLWTTQECVEHGLLKLAAQVEERERERCCKDVCGWCESTKWGRAEKVGDHWIHQYENAVVDCEAAAIRERSVTRGQ